MPITREIEVLPSGHDDWIVREREGRELGHYPTAKVAKDVAEKLARKRRAQLVIYAGNGKVQSRSRPGRGWFGRLFGG